MDLWIPITLAAAFFQNLRSALQKQLTESLSTWGVTSARFFFAAPLAVLFATALLNFSSDETPLPNGPFLLYGAIGGTAQILGTGLLIQLFSYRNFAIGTAFTKTEAIQTALFGLVVLGDTLTTASAVAIIISVIGVVLISTPRPGTGSIFNRATLTGLASGAFFGISAVAYRGASLSLDGGNYLSRASLTLACVTVFQSILIAVWLRLREPGEVTRVFNLLAQDEPCRLGWYAGVFGLVYGYDSRKRGLRARRRSNRNPLYPRGLLLLFQGSLELARILRRAVGGRGNFDAFADCVRSFLDRAAQYPRRCPGDRQHPQQLKQFLPLVEIEQKPTCAIILTDEAWKPGRV